MLIWWGPELRMLYNDGYAPILGNKHPAALGHPGQEVWSEIWPTIGPMLRGVVERSEATWSEDQLLVLARHGFSEETYFTWSFSPLTDDDGSVRGIFTATTETTARVLQQRRQSTLLELGAQVATATRLTAACDTAIKTLGENTRDVGFALLYLLDADGRGARLCSTHGVPPGSATTPTHVALDSEDIWSLGLAISTRSEVVIDDVEARLGQMIVDEWPEPVQRVVVLPLATNAAEQPLGVMVVGVSPRLTFDGAYRDFLCLANNHVASALTAAKTREEERRRSEALTEIDHAKTVFFSNVSHEFRTPLTLMLGPLEDAVAGGALTGEALSIAHRNALRLLKLVNTLLDFSRIEAGRVDARFEPTDLAQLTRELSSAFEPAVIGAGLRYELEIEPLPEPVYVDPSLWERIVLNLVSNAFKFTFSGGIRVALCAVDGAVELAVSDSGIGVTEQELPRLFERFHRVEGARCRSHEGSGIGLALVQELVRMHSGSITVSSKPNTGSTFTVRIPLGFAHLPQDRIHAHTSFRPLTASPLLLVDDAQSWVEPALAPPPKHRVGSARILIADDNADMREYVARVLGAHWNVELATDGASALAAVRNNKPDLVVADIMMPQLDGFALLKEIRADPTTAKVPVIFLSARAGDDARVIGLEAGAADYLVKPFAARELVARVALHLELACLRSDADAIQRISSRLTAELDLDKLVQLITDEATKLVGAQFGAFFYNVVNANHESYTLYTLSGVPREAFSKFPMPRNTHVFGPTFRGEGVVRIDDIKKDVRYGKNPPFNGMPEGHLPVCSYLAAPVMSRTGEVLGGLFFGHAECGVFAERHEHILTSIAAQSAVAIDNARLYDRVHELLESEREARETAEHANRAKDEFLAVLGHELRNPLAPIQTALQLMALRGDAQTKERMILERQTGHLIRLVDDLLDVSRITRGKIDLEREQVELSSVVAEAIEMASPLIEQKRHHLTVSVPRTGLIVDVDPGRMAQVISNLLTNAAKYTPAEGEIDVVAKRDGEEVCVHVKDNGIGIAAESIGRVFDPFVQEQQALDRARGGLGLGLTIVRNFVKLHGGTVSAASDGANAGSTFTVRLPAVASTDVSDEMRTTQPFRVARANARRVLVVDDNVDAAELIVATLESLGHQAEAAFDGPSALEVAVRLVPNVALLDIGLPVMDGYELARRLRELPALRETRLIALTGYGTDDDRARSLQAGFDEHLVKPLALARLEAVLDALPS